MNNFVDWEYYNSHFPKIDKAQFDKLKYHAERIVLKRLSTTELTEEQETDVKDCICNVINQMDANDGKGGVASVSNDGYSVSYATSTSDEKKQSVEDIIQEWLGDSGLLKRRFVAF